MHANLSHACLFLFTQVYFVSWQKTKVIVWENWMINFDCVDPRNRNSYKNQPGILKWNLLKLAEAIQDAVPLKETSSALEEL